MGSSSKWDRNRECLLSQTLFLTPLPQQHHHHDVHPLKCIVLPFSCPSHSRMPSNASKRCDDILHADSPQTPLFWGFFNYLWKIIPSQWWFRVSPPLHNSLSHDFLTIPTQNGFFVCSPPFFFLSFSSLRQGDDFPLLGPLVALNLLWDWYTIFTNDGRDSGMMIRPWILSLNGACRVQLAHLLYHHHFITSTLLL